MGGAGFRALSTFDDFALLFPWCFNVCRGVSMHSDPIFRYRNRAKAIRDIRDRTVDPGMRRLMDDLAADYETVAEVLARIDQTQRVIAERQPPVFSAGIGSSDSRGASTVVPP